jgi:integrase
MKVTRLTLSGVLQQYVASRLGLRESSAEQMHYSAQSLEKHVGRKVYADELSETMLLAFLKAQLKVLKPTTVKRQRGDLLTLWRFAHKRGWSGPVPDVEPIKVPRRNPQAWSTDDLQKLLAVTFRLRGDMRGTGIRKADWYTSFALFLYDTGSRLTAALAIESRDVDLKARTVLLLADNSKVGLEQVCTLSEQTADWIGRHYDAGRDLVWPYPWHKRRLWLDLKEIAGAAGVPCDHGEGFHRFRRTFATAAVNVAGWEVASRSLGHTSTNMTKRYVDQRLVRTPEVALPRPRIA